MERRKVKHLHIIDNVKKILIIFLCLIITIIVFRMTYSSYETRATSKADLGVAFFVVKENFDSMTVNLNEMIEPGQDGTNPSQYTFTFKVLNYNDERRTEVTTYYDLTLKITTNLELTYDVLKDGSSCVESNVVSRDPEPDPSATPGDGDSTYSVTGDDLAYFRRIKLERQEFGFTQNEEDDYTLVVTFPAEYKDLTRYKSDDIIDGIEITCDAKQKIED